MNMYSIKSYMVAAMVVIACSNASSAHAMGSNVAWQGKARWDKAHQQAVPHASSTSASSATPVKPVTLWNGATVGAHNPPSVSNVWKWVLGGSAVTTAAWAVRKAVKK